jgi:glycosyltransferase involved in cell wall biosynthesis
VTWCAKFFLATTLENEEASGDMSSESFSLTVVTPSFNQATFLERTIKSVLSQDVPGLEYLIFDGGSTDGSVTILEQYRDRARIVVEKDTGQAHAVNKGLSAARGEVIGWLNSDDIYHPGACARALEAFRTDPMLDVVYGEADHIDEHDGIIEPYYTETFDFDRLKEVCFICQPATFFRRRVVERYGELRRDLRYCMDYEYWLRICGSRPPQFLQTKLAGSRLHAETKTLGSRVPVHREIAGMLTEKFGRPPARWIYNLAHAIVEESGFTRNTSEDNLEFVTALVRESRRAFKGHGGVPLKEHLTMARWLWAARQAQRRARRDQAGQNDPSIL